MANGLFKSSNASAGVLSSAQVANSTDIKTASLFNSQQKQVEEQRKIIDEYYAAQNAPKDNGGFFGGIGYAFEKLGLGFLQSIEGIWDYTAGGLADLFGAHDWAEKQIANDWVNYGHADEWFNPSDGWKVAGDVAGGIGTSLPAIATVAVAAAITYFSGGTLAPAAAGLIGGVVAGLGAAGTATKEAYKETGTLSGKEWGYGTLSGFTEGAMEGVSDAIGFGVGSIVKNLAGSTAKEGAKQVGKQIAKSAARQTFGKTVLKSFLSEAFEEGVQELIDPVWKRITYDPNAESATFQQVAYAALVGGLSGAIMGGADVTVRNSINYFSGSKTTANGGAQGVIDLATTIAETEGVNQSGNAQVDFVVNTLSELQESLKTTNGEVRTAKQKMLVGILSKANTAAPLSIVVHQNADAIIADAETTVKRLNDIGYKTSKGEAVTVEMLKQGVTGERGTTEYRRSLSEAMKTNEALRSVAVMSAAGQLNMDAARFQQSTLRGEQLFNQSDLNHFVETATEQQKRDVGERLGIADWATVTADELKSRIVEFSTNGGLDQYINERNEIKKLTELEISKKGLPKYVGSIKQDGAVRYKFGDASVAIVKNGDTYLVYDYANDIASKPLTKTEANRVIREIYAASVQSATDSDVQTKAQQETQQLDAFARENVPDYKNLVGAQQQAVRQTLRQARAAGVSEADQILYASVAARSGVNIEFVSAEALGANADAGYSLKNGKILVNREMANNPKSRTAAKILLHEFTHGMIHRGYSVKGKKGNQHIENKVLNDFFTTAIKGLSTEQQIEILTPYVERHGVKMQDFLDGKVDISVDTYIELREELAAHFVERELGNSAALKRIISDKPSFKDKLLSFLKRSKSDYSSNEKLSRAANALLKKYQAFFNKYATQNRFSPTITGDTSAYQTTEAADAQTRLSIKKINGKDVVVIDTDQHIFDGVERAAMGKTVRSYMKERYRGRSVNGTAFTAQSEREYTHSRDSQRLYNQTDGAYEAKMRASTELNNIIQTGELIGQETAKHPQTINEGGVKRYKVSFVLDGKAFNGEMIIAIDKSGVETFYDVVKIKESESSNNAPDGAVRTNAPTTDIISNNEENVNPNSKKRYALSEIDSDARALTAEQRKFFQNSKFTDTSGHLLTLYHQTAADFTIFDTSIKGAGQHDYLTPFGIFMKPTAKNIGIKGNKQMTLYGNVVNPIEFADRAALESYLRDAGFGKQIDEILNIDEEYKAKSDAAEKRYMELATKAYKDPENNILQGQLTVAEQEWSGVIDEWGKAFDKRSAALKELVNKHFRGTQYDGIILRKDGGSFGRETMAYIAFEPNQVKSVSNMRPTNSADIRFALSGAEFQERVIAAQDMRDEVRGYKKKLKINTDGSVTVYHGTSAKNAEEIRSTGIINGQSYFTTNAGEAYYYAHQKNKNGVVLEIHADARALEFAAAGAEIYAPSKLVKIDGVYTSSDIRYALNPMSEEQYRFVSKISMIEATQTGDNSYSVYCENNGGFLEYQASNLTYEKLKKYFGDELAAEITNRANENGKAVKILRDTIAPIVDRYNSLSNIGSDIYKAAKKKFGTTTNPRVAGYINVDGTMLDFSGGYDNYRFYDHRDIADIMSDLSGTQAMNAYIAQGNIRLMPESPSIELDYQHEPTAKQYTTIRKVVDTLLAELDNYGKFYLEFSNENSSVESREYGRNTPTGKILSDIQYFYKNGALPQQSELSKFRYALQADSDYMSAAEQGNTTEAQRLVAEAAKKSGYDYRAYHGTLAKNFTEFKKDLIGSRYSFDEKGFFFIDRYSIARDYSLSDFDADRKGRVLDVYLKIKNPLVVDANFALREGLGKVYRDNDAIGVWDSYSSFFLEEAENRNADGIILNDGMSKMYVVFEPNQIKSAEAITYSDDGKIIPLSERFADEKTDIRYALPETDSTGKKLTEQQRRFFNESMAVDEEGRLLVVYHGSKASGFNVFNYDPQNQTGEDYGKAFYFTTNYKNAQGYSIDSGKDERIKRYHTRKQVLLHLYTEAKTDGERAAIRQKINSLRVDGKTLQELVNDLDNNTGGEIKECYLNLRNPLIRDAKGAYFFKVYDKYFAEARENGNDGIIVYGVNDSSKADVGLSDVYIAFTENQIKLTTNQNPTQSNDIRYALDMSKRQDKTSAATSINSAKLPVLYGKVAFKTGTVNLDIGGGRFDNVTDFLATKGVKNYIYDPYNRSAEHNAAVAEATQEGQSDTVTISNVLNVIDSLDGRRQVLENAVDAVKPDGTVYITVYEGDGSGIARSTGKDQFQLNRKTADYVSEVQEYFDDVIVKNKVIIANSPKKTSASDIRYAINPTESDNSGAIGGLTRGQRAKFVANNTKFKVYSKLDATSVIDSIIAERLTLRDGQYEGVLSGKNRAEVIEKLFTKLNSTPEGYRIGVALDIADYIINNAVLTDMYETYNDDSYAMGVLSIMRHYMHGMDLSGIQSEIQYKFDRKNSINLVWGAKKDGIAPDVVAQELEGYGIHIEAINEAEQFFEMLELYERAREQVNQKAEKIMLTAIGSKTEIEQLRQKIARDVLLAYDKKGTPSKYAKLVEQYTKKIADLKKDLSTAYKRNTLTNRIIDGAAYLRDIANKRNYVGAEIFAAPELTQWLKQLSKIKYRSDLRKTGVRKILLDYGLFYNTNNALLYDENPDLSYIDNNVIDALNFIRQNALSTKPLSMEELQAAEIIIASAKHLFNNYDQIIIEGKKAKISELATEGNEIIKKSKNRTNKTFFNKIYGVFNKIIEPRVVIKSLENFNPNGILTRAYAEVTRGETEAGLLYIELTNDIDTYIKKHKRFKNRLTSEYITVAGAELTVGQAISLYELSKRTQAQEGLYESGFSYIDKKGSKQTAHITEADITAMYDAFTDTDKGFIELVETFFNVASKQVKTDADMQILGYTNASDEFYYPIKRDSGTIAKNITDARSIMADWANVYNFSFNKDVKTGAKNKLFVTDVYSIVTRHAKQLSTYAKMTVPLKNFSQIYAKNIGDKTNVVSIRNTINEQVWGGAESYLSKLFSDIQGRATSNSIIEKMRGAYAKYQLGANLKVIVSQITSYPTAGIMLDSGVMAKGFVMKTNWAAMDKYCPYARVRNYERGIVRAEGVVDKIGKVGDVLTKPIQWTDRFTIGRLWNACQLQVQKDTGLKYGTVENMQKAGDMLEEVIRLTQPNYTNTERSELMRSDSDIVRSFTMFTSVPLKQLSRLVESFGEYNALRSLIKSGDSDPTLSKRYKLAKKKIRRTLASVTIANLMYVLVGQFFKFLYNNMAEDDEEGKVTAKSFFLDMLKDFGSTTIGMLPVVRDIYGYFVNGYEIESFTGDMLNSIIGSAKSLFELATKAASGEEIKTQEYMSIFRNSLYSIGQVTGIPVRNINNTITGLVRRFSPSAAYSYTSLFYNPKYSTDIKAALKKGDYELAEMIMGMLLKDDRTGSLSSKATQKLIELYDAGYTVLPKSIGNTLTYNGETVQLTAAQQSAFKTIYSQANAEIEKLVNSAEFATLPAERQAKAIKLLYDAYYSKAQASVLKQANDNKIILLSGAISPSTLAPHLSAISAIESDTDKAGNVINGSKKAKVIKYVMAQKLATVQKLLLILSLGYTIKDGDIRGISALKAKRTVARYITNLSISKEEKTALAEKCGLTVKNGRIYAK